MLIILIALFAFLIYMAWREEYPKRVKAEAKPKREAATPTLPIEQMNQLERMKLQRKLLTEVYVWGYREGQKSERRARSR